MAVGLLLILIVVGAVALLLAVLGAALLLTRDRGPRDGEGAEGSRHARGIDL
jgi:hypothetical protein